MAQEQKDLLEQLKDIKALLTVICYLLRCSFATLYIFREMNPVQVGPPKRK